MFYGWYIVGACVVISMYITGTVYLGFTAIFEPIAKEMGWSYTQISLAASLRGFEVGLLVPIAGMVMDRWGPRRLMISGLILSGFGMILLSRMNSMIMFYSSFIVISVGLSSTPTGLLMTIVSKWFRKKEGMVMGITAAGVSFGGLLLPVMTFSIDAFGWRQAIFFVGLGMFAIPLPLSLFLRHKPEEYGYLPDGADFNSLTEKGRGDIYRKEYSSSSKEALSSWIFWLIAIAFSIHVLAVSAVITHIMPYLSTLGVERTVSSLIASAIPMVGIFGRIGFGILGDRFDKRNVAALSLIITASGALILGLISAYNTWMIIFFVIFFGLGWGGAVPMLSGLMIHYFGREKLGTIVGFAGSVMMIGNVCGAPFAGFIFDKFGNYRPAWFLYSGLLTAVMIVFLSLLKTYTPKRWTGHETRAMRTDT